MEMDGRVAVVTGGAMGMGLELCLLLAKAGCSVALCDINEAALRKAVASCTAARSRPDAKITAHVVDLADRQAIARFQVEVQAEHGSVVHLLFNNAGMAIAAAWDRMTEAAFDKVMAVNLDGVVTATRAFWPMLLKADEAAVVNTSSVAGFFPPASGYSIPYAVSKYAVRGFSEALIDQCRIIAPHITVTCVHPGAVITEIVGVNMDMPDADERFIEDMPPWVRAELLAVPEGEARIAALKAKASQAFNRFGLRAPKAAAIIFDAVRRKQTRVLVGWDATVMDLAVRLFPRIFASASGTALVLVTGWFGQYLIIPAAVVAAGILIRASL